MGTQLDRPGYPFQAYVWLGEDPDKTGAMIGLETDVRLADGHWYADVFGQPLRCVQVFNVIPETNQPFPLPEPWAALVVPDDDSPEYEDIVTAWDGECWVGSTGPIDGMIDNPKPLTPRTVCLHRPPREWPGPPPPDVALIEYVPEEQIRDGLGRVMRAKLFGPPVGPESED